MKTRLICAIILILLFIPISFAVCDSAKNIIAQNLGQPDKIVAGDLNNDNSLDIAFSDSVNDNFNWSENNGNGNFPSAHFLGSSNFPSDIVIDDVNNDGYNDVIGVSQLDKELIYYENNQDETFTTTVIDTLAGNLLSVVSGDFNGDGEIDIAVGDYTSNTIFVYLNDGSESFTSSGTTFNLPSELFAIDMDNDNDLDLVSSSAPSDDISWFENYGDATFQERVISTSIESPEICVLDFDNDGYKDVLAIPTDNNGDIKEKALQFLKNDGSFNFDGLNITTNESFNVLQAIECGDIDSDGDNDIFTFNTASNELLFYQHDGNLNFNIINITTTVNGIDDFLLADLDGDNALDLVYSDITDKLIGYFDNDRCSDISRVDVATLCPEPLLFCDTFNYNTNLRSRDWRVNNADGSSNTTLTPTNNTLALENTNALTLQHIINTHDTYYSVDEIERVTRSWYAPQFSTEFQFFMTNNTNITADNCLRYEAQAPFYTIYDVGFCPNGSIMNLNPANQWVEVCSDCFTRDGFYNFFKINILYSQKDDFPFNSTYLNDSIEIYVNGREKYTIYQFKESGSQNFLRRNIIKKSEQSQLTIDNYFVMYGTDRNEDTTPLFFEQFYTNDSVILSSVGKNEPCTTNEECSTGKCQYGMCVLKQGGEDCTSDSQCISQQCLNGLCKKGSFWQRAEQSKDESFGDDKNTNNFLSVFLMIAIPAVIVIFSGGASIAILIALVVFFVEGFFFAIVGWLSPFILLGMVISALVIVVFALVIKGSSS